MKIKYCLINFTFILLTIFILTSCKVGSSEQSGNSSNASGNNGDSPSDPPDDENPTPTLNEGLALEIVTYLFNSLESSASYKNTRNSKRLNITSGQIDLIIEESIKNIKKINLEDSDDLILVLPAVLSGSGKGLGKSLGIADSTRTEVLEVFATVGSGALSERRDHLKIESAAQDETALETLMRTTSSTLTAMIDTVGMESDNLSQVGGKIIKNLISNYQTGGITANEADGVLSKTISGGLSGLNEVDRFSETTSFKEALTNLVEESTSSIDQIPGHSSDRVKTRMKSLSEGSIEGISSISMENSSARLTIDTNQIIDFVSTVTLTTVASIDRIEGINVEDLAEITEKVAEGMVGGLQNLSIASDETTFSSLAETIVESAVGGLDEIEIEGYTVETIDDLIGGITYGATTGLKESTEIMNSTEKISSLLQTITISATKGLDQLDSDFMDNASVVPDIVNQITFSVLESAKQIKPQQSVDEEEFLSQIIGKVTVAATETVKDIKVVKQENTNFDVNTTMSKIMTGIISGSRAWFDDESKIEKFKNDAGAKIKILASDNFNYTNFDPISVDVTPPNYLILYPSSVEEDPIVFFVDGTQIGNKEQIKIEFSEPIDLQLKKQGSYHLIKGTDLVLHGEKGYVPLRVVSDNDTDGNIILTLIPDVPLSYDSLYTLHLKQTLKDLNGNRIKNEITRKIRTESPPSGFVIRFIPVVGNLTFHRGISTKDCISECLIATGLITHTDGWNQLNRQWTMIMPDGTIENLTESKTMVLSDVSNGDSITEGFSSIILEPLTDNLSGTIHLKVMDLYGATGDSEIDFHASHFPKIDDCLFYGIGCQP